MNMMVERRGTPQRFDDPTLPQVMDRAIHQTSLGEKNKGTITRIYKNGRIEFTPDDTTRRSMSLPRIYQKSIRGQQYGLTFVE
jgi:hypothetical protein